MIFDGCHFEYGNFNSREYSLVFAHLDTSVDTRLSGEIESQYVFNKKNMSRRPVGNDYSGSCFSTDVEIVTSGARHLGHHEKRAIEKSLFNRSSYRKLYIDVASDYYCETYEYVDGVMKRFYLECRFMNPQAIEDGAGRTIGYRCTMECSSPMFIQDAITKKIDINHRSNTDVSTITVNIDTDLDEYIYPTVTVNVGQVGGNVIVCNNTDNSERITSFVNISPSATITMRGDINYVSGQYYEKFADRNFIRLLDGENTFTVMGNVESITFEYSQRRAL